MGENYDVRDEFEDGNEGFKDPVRRERRRPEESCSRAPSSNRLKILPFCIKIINQLDSKTDVNMGKHFDALRDECIEELRYNCKNCASLKVTHKL